MEITVRELEEYLGHLYKKHSDDHGLFMKLVEEIGEVAEVLNKISGRKSSGGEDLEANLASELADVIHYAVAIAAVHDIDLNQTILDKDERASVKYRHDTNFRNFVLKSK